MASDCHRDLHERNRIISDHEDDLTNVMHSTVALRCDDDDETFSKMAANRHSQRKSLVDIELSRKERYDECLQAMKEDLAAWFNTLYDLNIDIAEANLLDYLETGVLLLRHATVVHDAFLAWNKNRENCSTAATASSRSSSAAASVSTSSLSSYLAAADVNKYLSCHNKAATGSFHARSNISNFLSWCRGGYLQLADTVTFETEDLIKRRNERNVVLCLLEVARHGAKYGVLAPDLVRLEAEIDEEIANDAADSERLAGETQMVSYDSATTSGFEGDSDLGDDDTASGNGCMNEESTNDSEPSETSDDRSNVRRPSSLPVPKSYRRIIATAEKATASIVPHQPPAAPLPRPNMTIQIDMMTLDEMVRNILAQCTCNSQYPMIRLAEGKYMIGENLTVIFVRILRNHVMVRIGGGWDTLENYLNRHDPCRCLLHGTRAGHHDLSVLGSVQSRVMSAAAAYATTPSSSSTGSPASSAMSSELCVISHGVDAAKLKLASQNASKPIRHMKSSASSATSTPRTSLMDDSQRSSCTGSNSSLEATVSYNRMFLSAAASETSSIRSDVTDDVDEDVPCSEQTAADSERHSSISSYDSCSNNITADNGSMDSCVEYGAEEDTDLIHDVINKLAEKIQTLSADVAVDQEIFEITDTASTSTLGVRDSVDLEVAESLSSTSVTLRRRISSPINGKLIRKNSLPVDRSLSSFKTPSKILPLQTPEYLDKSEAMSRHYNFGTASLSRNVASRRSFTSSLQARNSDQQTSSTAARRERKSAASAVGEQSKTTSGEKQVKDDSELVMPSPICQGNFKKDLKFDNHRPRSALSNSYGRPRSALGHSFDHRHDNDAPDELSRRKLLSSERSKLGKTGRDNKIPGSGDPVMRTKLGISQARQAFDADRYHLGHQNQTDINSPGSSDVCKSGSAAGSITSSSGGNKSLDAAQRRAKYSITGVDRIFPSSVGAVSINDHRQVGTGSFDECESGTQLSSETPTGPRRKLPMITSLTTGAVDDNIKPVALQNEGHARPEKQVQEDGGSSSMIQRTGIVPARSRIPRLTAVPPSVLRTAPVPTRTVNRSLLTPGETTSTAGVAPIAATTKEDKSSNDFTAVEKASSSADEAGFCRKTVPDSNEGAGREMVISTAASGSVRSFSDSGVDVSAPVSPVSKDCSQPGEYR